MSSVIEHPTARGDQGARRDVNGMSTYEALRLAVLEELAQTKIDHHDRSVVTAFVRDHVERHQRTAEGGSALRFSKPDDIIERLVRSLVGAGPFEKFFVQPDLADEVSFKRDVITYFTRDGRQMIDREPTSEAELTAICQRLLADAGVAVDLENPVVVHQVWGNQVRASVSIPPVSDCLDGTFRIYRPHRTDLTDLVELGSMSPQAANFVAAFQRAPTGVLVTGGPGSGKSTIASALLRVTPATTITRIVQEIRELDAPHLPGGRWSPEAGGHTIRSLGATIAAVRAATARGRRDARRRGIRTPQGRQRRMRIPHDAARELRPARHAVAGDRGADGRREHSRAGGTGDVRSSDRPRHPLRG